MSRFDTLDELFAFNRALHAVARKANIFCKDCSYCSNGVLDEHCNKENCPEEKFEAEFYERYKNERN